MDTNIQGLTTKSTDSGSLDREPNGRQQPSTYVRERCSRIKLCDPRMLTEDKRGDN
jgi:hypothetical protein